MKYKSLIIGIIILSIVLIGSIALINSIGFSKNSNGSDDISGNNSDVKSLSWDCITGDIELGSYKNRKPVLQLYSGTSTKSAKTQTSFKGFISAIIELDLYFTFSPGLEEYIGPKIYLLDDTVKVITFEQSREVPINKWLTLRITFDCTKEKYTISIGGFIQEIDQSFSATKINGILIEVPYHAHLESIIPWEMKADNYLYVDFISIAGIKS